MQPQGKGMSLREVQAVFIGAVVAVWGVFDVLRLGVLFFVLQVAPNSELAGSLLASIVIKEILGPFGIVVAVDHLGIEALTSLVSVAVVAFVIWTTWAIKNR